MVVGTEYVALSVERGSEEWVCRECSTVSCWCVDDVQGLCVDDIPRLCEDDNTVMKVLSERSCQCILRHVAPAQIGGEKV